VIPSEAVVAAEGKAPEAESPRWRPRPFRLALLALLVASTWLLAARWLGAGGEAFWLLFPVWVIGGDRLLGAIRMPPPPGKTRAGRIATLLLLVLFPSALYLGLAWLARAGVSLRELLISIYFFVFSLGLLLLYAFRGAELLAERFSRGRRRAVRIGMTLATRAPLYLLLVPFLMATFSLHRVKILPLPPARELHLAPQEVGFPSRGQKPVTLRGSFFSVENPQGAILACHGVGANRADILAFVSLFHDLGFQVLTFDFRGHGESDGHTVTYGAEERNDVLGGWDYLLSRSDVDPQRIFGFGVSMGAASLLLALPDLPGMRAAVVDSSFDDLETMLRYQYRHLPDRAAAALAGLTEFFGWLETGLRPRQVSPLKAIERVRIPLLFYHGSEDPVIPVQATENLHRAYQGPKRLRIARGAGHGGTFSADPVLYRIEVRAFLLGAPGG
jgi:alpha-beta hydrolase superfamily lysophospholipase